MEYEVGNKTISVDGCWRWFEGGMKLQIQIMATVGYGQVSLHTTAGRIYFMVYSLVAIPVFGVWVTLFADIYLTYMGIFLSYCLKSNFAHDAFNEYDENKDGGLDRGELRLALSDMSVTISDSVFQELWQSFDEDGGGT